MLIFTFQSINPTPRVHARNLARILTITSIFQGLKRITRLNIKSTHINPLIGSVIPRLKETGHSYIKLTNEIRNFNQSEEN